MAPQQRHHGFLLSLALLATGLCTMAQSSTLDTFMSIAYVGCYVDDGADFFDSVWGASRGGLGLEECALAANVAGAARFAMLDAQAPQLSLCAFGNTGKRPTLRCFLQAAPSSTVRKPGRPSNRVAHIEGVRI